MSFKKGKQEWEEINSKKKNEKKLEMMYSRLQLQAFNPTVTTNGWWPDAHLQTSQFCATRADKLKRK
jgi:hypothetical protein